jgi:type I restriction enzyme M protein
VKTIGSPILDWWNQREENEHAWRVSIDEIKARNYNLDIKNPHDPGSEHHDSDQLLADYAKLQEEIAATRDQLKAILSSALSGA